MPPKIPLGIDDFSELRRGGYAYVDKSLFVRDVLGSGSKVLLLPRPRRFGKTLNLSMLRSFLDRMAPSARPLFEGLALSREGREVWENAQRYPVIALTLKDVRADSWEMTSAILRDRITALFSEHREVLTSGKLPPVEEAFFRRILDGSAGPADYALSLLHLASALHAHHGEKAFLLIDEYDAPLHAGHAGGYLREALDFFRIFLGAALKQNPHLEKGVVTGILRVARESVFSGLNNLDVCTLLSEDFRAAFGFTEPEVRDLFAETGYLESLSLARTWYNGYIFGGEVIYNPWSVLSFVRHGASPAPYWLNTSANELVRDLLIYHAPALSREIEVLLEGGSIERRPEEGLHLDDLSTNREALWSLLLFSGYLRAERVPPLSGERPSYLLSIPNLEVRQVYLQSFGDWMRSALERRGGALSVLLEALLAGDAVRLEGELQAFAMEMLSFHDLGPREPERVYHAFVIGLLASLAPDYEVRSNRETGTGRADVLIRPRREGRPGVVLELKVARGKAGLTRALHEGAAQMKEKRYAKELVAAGAAPVHELVVAFDGKEVRVSTPPKSRSRAKQKPSSKPRAPRR